MTKKGMLSTVCLLMTVVTLYVTDLLLACKVGTESPISFSVLMAGAAVFMVSIVSIIHGLMDSLD